MWRSLLIRLIFNLVEICGNCSLKTLNFFSSLLNTEIYVELRQKHQLKFISISICGVCLLVLCLQIFVVSLAEPRLPLQIDDASRPETDEVGHYLI